MTDREPTLGIYDPEAHAMRSGVAALTWLDDCFPVQLESASLTRAK